MGGNGGPLTSVRSRRNAPHVLSSSLASTSLSTLLPDADIAEDMAQLFPDEFSKAGYLKRGSKATSAFDVKVEQGQLVYQGQKYAKGDKVKIGSLDGSTMVTGNIAGISFAELIIKSLTRDKDGGSPQKVRILLSNLRSGKYQLVGL